MSVTFSISVLRSFHVWGKSYRRRQHKTWFKELPHLALSASAVNGTEAALLAGVPIILAFNALSH